MIKSVTVSLTITRAGSAELELSRNALSFEVLRGASGGFTREFAVLNRGDAALRWRMDARRISFLNFGLGAESWTTHAGEFTRIAVDPLPDAVRGVRTGVISVSDEDSDEPPKQLTVVARAFDDESELSPSVSPSARVLLFNQGADDFECLERLEDLGGEAGPTACKIFLDPLFQTDVTYTTRPIAVLSDGGLGEPLAWFSVAPEGSLTSLIGSGQRHELSIRPVLERLAELETGFHRAQVQMGFRDSDSKQRDRRIVDLLLVVTPPVSTQPSKLNMPAQSACGPAQLDLVFLGLRPQFDVVAGVPVSLDAQVVNGCGNPITLGSVVATFSNGDAPVRLILVGDRNWTGSWQPSSSDESQVRVILTARISGTAIAGEASLDGHLLPNPGLPILRAAGIVSAASFDRAGSIAPGAMISLFGERLADTTAAAQSLPLPVELGEPVFP